MLTLKRKMHLFSLMLSIVPVLVLGLLSSFLAARSVQEEVIQHHQTALKQIRSQVDSFINQMDQISLFLAANETIVGSLDRGLSIGNVDASVQAMSVIHNIVATSDVPFEVSLILTQFNTVYSSRMGLIRQIDSPLNEIVKQMQRAQLTSLKVSPNTYVNQPDMLIVRSIPINSSSPKGVVVLHLNVNRFHQLIEQTEFFGNRHIILVDDQNQLILSGMKGQGESLSPTSEPFMAAMSFLNHSGEPHEDYIISSVLSAVNSWNYIAISPTKDVYQRADDIRKVTWLLVLIICLIWGLAAVIGLNLILVPLQRLFQKLAIREGGGQETDIVTALDRYMDDMHDTNERLQKRLNEQMPVLKEHFLQQLIRGERSSVESESEIDWHISSKLSGNQFYVGVVDLDRFIAFKQTYNDRDRSLIMFALRKMIEEIVEEHYPALVFTPKQGQVVFIIGVGEATEASGQTIRSIGIEILNKVKLYFQFTVSTAIAEPREGLAQIHYGYEQALSYLEYRWTIGPNAMITSQVIGPSMSLSNKEMVKKERAIVSSVAKGDFESARQHLHLLVQDVSTSLGSSESVRGLFAYLVGELDDLLQ
ncbi:MAG: AraC family transcriptional regulator, partial [Paenibacillus sp.]|nr:AraC family transcriptional regulator [Paenibacillus sp.]